MAATNASAPDIVGVLQSIPLCSGLSAVALNQLVALAEPVAVDAGGVVFEEGEVADSFYVVASGLFLATTGEPETVVRRLRAGDGFGELGLLSGEPRSATVRAARDGVVWRLSGASFERLLGESAPFAEGLARSLGRRMRSGFLPAARELPRVVAVVALHDDAPVDVVVDGIRAHAQVRAAVVDGAVGRRSDWAARVDALENDHELVVLAARDDSTREFRSFCYEESDRVLGVASHRFDVREADQAMDLVLWGDAVRSADNHHNIHFVAARREEQALARLTRRLTGRSIGLVLSGGGARGVAHVGVLHALREQGVAVDRYAGTSFGALVAALAAQGTEPAAIEAMLRRELVPKHPFRDYTIPRVSLIRAERARGMLERVFGQRRIEQLDHSLCCTTADLLTAERVAHRRGTLVEVVGASMSLPGVAPPRRLDGRVLVDGGVLDNLPVDILSDDGEGPVIAVDVMARGLPRSMQQSPDALPAITETIGRALTMASRQGAEVQRARATVMIDPEVASIGLFDFAKFDSALAAGRRATVGVETALQ